MSNELITVLDNFTIALCFFGTVIFILMWTSIVVEEQKEASRQRKMEADNYDK